MPTRFARTDSPSLRLFRFPFRTLPQTRAGALRAAQRPFRITFAGEDAVHVTVVLPTRERSRGPQGTLPGILGSAARAGHHRGRRRFHRCHPEVRRRPCGARCCPLPYAMGNGAVIKRGGGPPGGEIPVFMDADGQRDCLPSLQLLAKARRVLRHGGGRARCPGGSANARARACQVSTTGGQLDDRDTRGGPPSGFRAVRTDRFREFLRLLPNGFSYPHQHRWPSSVAPVRWPTCRCRSRAGSAPPAISARSRDGVRFLLIIFRSPPVFAAQAVRPDGIVLPHRTRLLHWTFDPRASADQRMRHAALQRLGDRGS